MKKLLVSFLVILLTTFCAEAKSVKCDFMNVINEYGADKNSISVSIKNAESSQTVFALNDKMLMHPASVQKILTTPVSAEVLGRDYKFRTILYKRDDDKYIIKLSGDPYLSTKDLKTLISQIPPETQHIYIDDSILDNKNWGEGWQWDDDLNTLMPKFGAYNLDKNLIKITIIPNKDGSAPQIVNSSKYPLVFYNNLTNSDKTDINIQRENSISENAIRLKGTVARPTTVYIPTNNLKRYFEISLTQALENHKIYLKEKFKQDRVKPSDTKVAEVSHELSTAIDDILKNSNNMVSETVFKLAGGKYTASAGSDINGIKAFREYCAKNKLDTSRIKIVDGSGVSKNNLISSDFVSDFLILNKNNIALKSLPSPGEGTLINRMSPVKNNLKAKTGTLSDVSSIAGYLTSRSGKKYVFCIIINDMTQSPAEKKTLEDYIIREAYLRL